LPVFNNPSEVRHLAQAHWGHGRCTLNGRMEYLVLGGTAQHALVPVQTAGASGFSYVLVNMETTGVRRSEPILSLGLHACPAVDLTLSEAAGEPVGETGRGEECFERAVDRLSVAAAAASCGVIKGSFRAALDYARQRMQGGREIVNWSEVRMILSSMAVRGKTAEMLVRQAARAVDGEEPGWELASRAAALAVQEEAAEVTCDGIQLLGGNGYMQDYGQEKRFRDAKQLQALLGMVPLRRLRYIRRIVDGESPWE
jgi:alkylation response protein AidB-like acyl-CoA dehydrogenase